MGLASRFLAFVYLGFLSVGLFAPEGMTLGKPKSEDPSPLHPGEEGWVSLFEGGSLRGWKSSPDSDWAVSGGILRGREGRVLNRWCWVDFELVMEFRGRGSLLFRVGSDHVGHIGFEQPGYKLDLNGGVLWAGRRILARGEKPADSDEWQRLILTAGRGRYSLSIDDRRIFETVDDSFPYKGRIGVEADGGGLEVRMIRIRPLNREQEMNIPADNYYCYVCHANFEYDEPLVAVHEEADVGCARCHGPSLPHRSDEDNVTPPDIFYRHPQIEAACLQCHERHEDQAVPEGKSVGSDPACTDCHGEHHVANLNAGL